MKAAVEKHSKVYHLGAQIVHFLRHKVIVWHFQYSAIWYVAKEGQAFMTIQISVHILNKLAEIGVGTSINKNTYIEAILEAHLFGNDVVLGTNLAHLSDIAPVGCAAAVATDHTAQGAEAA